MTVNYNATVKTNRMNTARAAIDSQTFNAPTGAGAAGKLVIGTSGLSGATGVLVTLPLSNPCGTVSGSVLTISGTPSANATAGGTAAKAEFRTNADVTVVDGLTVGTSGSDINLTTTTIANGQTVTLNASGTITHG